MLEWDYLRIVLAIHRSGSMTAAAELLGVDRATVLRRLDAVEAQLKTRLFDRRPDGCTLTNSGRNIIGQVQSVEQAITALQHRVEGDDGRVEGYVKVAAPAFLLDHLIAPAIPLLRALHPHLTIELRDDNDSLDLTRGETDIALRILRPANEAVVARRIGAVAVALYGSADYLSRRGTPQAGDLDGHDLLILEGALGQVPAMGWLWAHLDSAKVPLRCHEIATLLAAVKAGGGIACLPVLVAEGMPDLVAIEPGVVGRFDVFLATHRDLRDRARVRSAFDFITRLFGQRSAILNGASVVRLFGGAGELPSPKDADPSESPVSAGGSGR